MIVSDHLETLSDKVSGKIGRADAFLFFIFPCAVGLVAAYIITDLPSEIYGLLVSIFAVFAALLLSVQISIFNFFQNLKEDGQQKIDVRSISDKIALSSRALQAALLKELNLNISYLILLCCINLILLLIFNLFSADGFFATLFLVSCVTHFFLTLLLIVKRGHIAFKIQYE